MESKIQKIVNYVERNYNNINKDLNKGEEKLRSKLERRYDNYTESIQSNRQAFENLSVPLERKDASETFEIDAPQQNTDIEKPSPSDKDPVPTMPDDTYVDILEAINSVGKGFERSKGIFENHAEEDYRDHILFHLEMNFEGSATGETFNKEGKSDILMRYEGENVFVAECSMWRGKENFKSKTSQLVENYLTWRDTKTALIFFVNQKKISHVDSQINEGAEEHDYILHKEDSTDTPGQMYRAHLPGDDEHRFDLCVLTFHIPPS